MGTGGSAAVLSGLFIPTREALELIKLTASQLLPLELLPPLVKLTAECRGGDSILHRERTFT